MRLQKLDTAFTALLLGFGIWILVQAAGLGITSPQGPGAGTFPMIAGALVTVFSAIELVRQTAQRRQSATSRATRPRDADLANERINLTEVGRVAGILALIGVYVLLFPSLGAFLTLPFVMAGISLVVQWRTDPAWLLTLAVVCVGFTFVCWLVFAFALRVLLPVGPFGF